jgi:hypothetical protein
VLPRVMMCGTRGARFSLAMVPRFLFDFGGRARIGELAVHDHFEEPRNEKDREKCRSEHAAHHAGSRGVPRPGAGAVGKHQRRHAKDEGERSHQDRAKPQARRLDRRGRGGKPLVLLQDCVLDDQDRVFRREPQQRHEADLEIHVVAESRDMRKRREQPLEPRHAGGEVIGQRQQVVDTNRCERAEGAEGQREHNRER